METDDEGDWYGVWIYDLDENTKDFLGSIRFPKTDPERAGIKDNAAPARQTFTELYDKKVKKTPIPTWHVSIRNIYVDDKFGPKHATSEYGKISGTGIYYDEKRSEIHFLVGPKVSRKHNAGEFF